MRKTKAQTPYWFKRRRYGYGWTPVTWQGWLTLTTALAVIVFGTMALMRMEYSNGLLWVYLNLVIFVVIILAMVAAKKGPTPKWRWGKKRSDNAEEDF